MDVRWRIKQETRISFYFICKSSQGKLSEKDKINTKIEIRKLSCEFFCSESRHMQLEEEICWQQYTTRDTTIQTSSLLEKPWEFKRKPGLLSSCHVLCSFQPEAKYSVTTSTWWTLPSAFEPFLLPSKTFFREWNACKWIINETNVGFFISFFNL